MTEHNIRNDEVDDVKSAHTALRLSEFRGFLEDLIDDPTPLSLIPDGSELKFLRVVLDGQQFRLTAYRPLDSDAAWSARVTSRLDSEESGSGLGQTSPPGQHDSDIWQPQDVDDLITTGLTDQTALDALAEKLRERSSSLRHGAAETLQR